MYTPAAPQPSTALATDWIQNAVNHYIHNFVIKPASGLPGFHAEVPHLYTYSADKTYLQSALQAVALTHLARMNRMGTDHLRRAQRLHGDAIQRLRTALSDDTEALSDSALVTTELLWQYDVCIEHQKSLIWLDQAKVGSKTQTIGLIFCNAGHHWYSSVSNRKPASRGNAPNSSPATTTRV
jgi:hypothetical protein